MGQSLFTAIRYGWFLPLFMMTTACVALPRAEPFTGLSATTTPKMQLRQEVLVMIGNFEQLLYECHQIDRVHSEIISEDLIDNRLFIEEEWEIQACSARRRYSVTLANSVNGQGTDITVRFAP